MLNTKVKASSITNLTDARYFAAWYAEWLGFNFNQGSDTSIPLQNMQAIREWVDGVKIVGEFSAIHSADDIQAGIELLNLDAVQLDMLVGVEVATEIKDLPIIKEIIVEKSAVEADIAAHLDDFSACTNTFLLDFDKNGWTWEDLKSQNNISIDFLKNCCQDYQILLSLDFTSKNIDEILETLFPYGISVIGGEEEKVGFKSFDDLDDLFEQLEVVR